jgi:hypothetical protein
MIFCWSCQVAILKWNLKGFNETSFPNAINDYVKISQQLRGNSLWFFALIFTFRKSSLSYVSEGLTEHRILNLNAFIFLFDKYVSVLHSFHGMKTSYSADVHFGVSESIFTYHFESALFFPADNLVGICILILFTCMFTNKNVSP